MTPMTKHVAVLMGGWSVEREVSLSSGTACAKALESAGFRVTRIDVQRDIAQVLADLGPDIAFNALHGRFGEDGCVQGVLDWLSLPYTHSGVRASSMAMDKHAAKAVFAAAGLPLAAHRIVSPEELEAADPLPRPYVVKPVNEGSSVGVEILREGDNRRGDIARSWSFGPQIMAEEFIPGRELTVAVMGGEALAVTEIGTGHAFYDYDAKYADGGSQHTIPAAVPEEIALEAKRIALQAHEALGCRGVSRADLRYDDRAGRVVLLEVNTQPGMTRTSLVPEQAAYRGIDFSALCAWMVQEARHGP
jgi:D-alanine-D-alanine ligase